MGARPTASSPAAAAAGAPLSAAASLDPAAPSIVPRAIIPAMEEIGLGSGVGSDGGFDLSSAPLQPIEHRFAFESGAAFGLPAQAGASGIAPEPPPPNWAANSPRFNAPPPPTP